MRRIGLLLFIIGSISVFSCVEVLRPFESLPPGVWRAELTLQKDVILPFNFKIDYEDKKPRFIIHNAEERISIDDISFGRTAKNQDTLVIDFAILDSYIEAEYKEGVMQGHWIVRNRENYRIPFVAYHGRDYRFSNSKDAFAADLTGNWKALFEVETPDQYPAVGEFIQKGNRLTGTFRTETGDYRYLEGEVQGDKAMMSCFDGSHAYLFEATIAEQDRLIGKFYSGNHYTTNWIATRDENYDLTDPFKLSEITTADKKIAFQFENTEGQFISLDDEKYNGKAKLIQIFGSWCPNCLDESRFLLDYVNQHPDYDLAIIGLAFERHTDEMKAKAALRNYKKRLGIPYELLFAGFENKEKATETLGFIDKIWSYPTLLFVTKDNKVTRVHTGF